MLRYASLQVSSCNIVNKRADELCNAQVILYLAKAYYESKNYAQCISTLSRAIHLHPNDMRLWYNIGLAQEDYAVATLGQESAPVSGRSGIAAPQRTMADVQRAILDLKRARRIFLFLIQQAEAANQAKKPDGQSKKPTLPFDKEKVSEHEKFCADTLTKASYHLEFERQKEEKRRLENEAQRKMLQEYEERLAKEKAQEYQRQEDLKKRRENVLSKQEERLKQLQEGWTVREREEEEKKVNKKKGGGGGGRKRKKDAEEDQFIDNGSGEDEDDDDEDGGSMSIEDMKNRNSTMKKLVEKRQKRARVESDEEKDEAADLFGSDSSDDEVEAKPTPSVAMTNGSDATEVEKNELFGSSSDSE